MTTSATSTVAATVATTMCRPMIRGRSSDQYRTVAMTNGSRTSPSQSHSVLPVKPVHFHGMR